MSPQELLRETQKAAGNERLTKWHEFLKIAGKELLKMLKVMVLLETFSLADVGPTRTWMKTGKNSTS